MSYPADFESNSSDTSNLSEINLPVHMYMPDWARYIRITYMVCIVILGVPGNALILFLQFKNAMKSSTDWFVSALATIDLSGASLSSLSYITTAFLGLQKIGNSSLLCQVHFYAIYVTSVTSAVLLCMVAIDRYIKACRPHSKLMTVGKAKWLSIVTAITVLVLYSPSFWVYDYDKKSAACKVQPELSRFELWLKIGMGFSFVLLFAIPIIAYSKIAIVLRGMKLNGINKHTHPHTKPPGHKAVKINRVHVTPEPCTSKSELDKDRYEGKHCQSHQGGLLTSRRVGSCYINRNREDIDILSDGEIRNNNPNGKPDTGIVYISYSRRDENPAQRPQVVKKAALDTDMNLKIQTRVEITKRKAHVTTKIMFILTMFFLLTWFISILSGTLAHVSTKHRNFRIASYLLHPIYKINFVCNPILYFSLSTKFKSKLLKLFKST